MSALAIVLLAGCSARFMYDRLDVAASWYAARFVSLDESQDRQLRSAIRNVLAWEREKRFGTYRVLLADFEHDIAAPLAPRDFARYFDSLSGAWSESARYFAPYVASLLATLRREQLTELFANMDKRNLEFEDEYLSKDSTVRLARREKSAVRAIQRFTGRLDESQRAIVHARLASLEDLSAAWVSERRDWQRRFRETVERDAGRTGFAGEIAALLDPTDDSGGAAYQSRVAANRRIVFAMLADISRTLDAKQKNHVVEALREFRDMLDTIAGEGDDAGK